MGAAQGVLGSFLIKLNIAAAIYRRNSVLYEWPLLEVTGAAAVTAAVSYLVRFELFVNLCSKES
jgi:chloride channel 3/4/5